MRTRGILVAATLFFTSLSSIITSAQDVIVKTSGEEIDAKVIEVTPELVKYYKFNKTDGPLYSVYITDINMIKYPDGSKDIFDNAPKDIQEVSKEEIEIDKFIDERDGREYKTVKIGDQWWMAENLQYVSAGSVCYDNDTTNCEECGQYYEFEIAMSACPNGWHLPSDKEWIILEITVGMSSIEAKKSGWRGTSPGQAPMLIAGGGSGLELEFCGNYSPFSGRWAYNNNKGYYWTSTAMNSRNAWARRFKLRKSIDRSALQVSYRCPVRCIKDTE